MAYPVGLSHKGTKMSGMWELTAQTLSAQLCFPLAGIHQGALVYTSVHAHRGRRLSWPLLSYCSGESS